MFIGLLTRWTRTIASIALVMLPIGVSSETTPNDGRTAASDTVLRGTVLAKPSGGPAIALAGFGITLRSQTNELHGVTDAFGVYTFRNPPAGVYRLCWESSGWTSSCAEREVIVGGFAEPSPIVLTPSGRHVWGRVLLADGTAAYLRDVEFEMELAATVEARVNGSPFGHAKANVAGDFLIANLPNEGIVNLVAQIGKAIGEVSATASPARTNIVIQARRPMPIDPSGREASGQQLEVRRRGDDTLFVNNEGLFTRLAKVLPPGSQGCRSVAPFFPCPPGTPPPLPPNGCDKSSYLDQFTSTEDDAKKYYDALDPNHKRDTLDAWLELAGFTKKGHGGTRAYYTNSNDLGFGRDMHIIKTEWGVFAYVTNYAENCQLQHPDNAKLAHKAPAARRIATVCMEWSSINYHGKMSPASVKDEPRIVKFFVFKGTGPRDVGADLDSKGFKYVPNLCVNCHGKRGYAAAGSVNLAASFLPFDLDTFSYDPAGRPRLRHFRKLNEYVLLTHTTPTPPSTEPLSTPISRLIEGWYRCGRKMPDSRFVPEGWSANGDRRKIYLRVVARACRTCHTALKDNLTWESYDQFVDYRDTIAYATRDGAYMPHALITKMNMFSTDFWPDKATPKILDCFLDNPDEAKMHDCLAQIP